MLRRRPRPRRVDENAGWQRRAGEGPLSSAASACRPGYELGTAASAVRIALLPTKDAPAEDAHDARSVVGRLHQIPFSIDTRIDWTLTLTVWL